MGSLYHVEELSLRHLVSSQCIVEHRNTHVQAVVSGDIDEGPSKSGDGDISDSGNMLRRERSSSDDQICVAPADTRPNHFNAPLDRPSDLKRPQESGRNMGEDFISHSATRALLAIAHSICASSDENFQSLEDIAKIVRIH
ncbi:hypothetical protein [Brevibacterium sp. UCMA 11752]|uniref:hypothetical protein n=1 Tax=Brevibacterium sp. UCMA 11752 TaxID=2745946 RepID=UPI001F3FEA14|nr:hypothetical protein [Brevibacterium sp. UCMA 11752]MCF2587560.1 hypothetical protein [Brevibacterium sp. UCMA 11752]